MNALCREKGYGTVIKNTVDDKQNRPGQIFYGCNRRGVRQTHHQPRPGSKRRPSASTRKCNYPMMINICRNMLTGLWVFDHRDSKAAHNHPPSTSASSRSKHRWTELTLSVRYKIVKIGTRISHTFARVFTKYPIHQEGTIKVQLSTEQSHGRHSKVH